MTDLSGNIKCKICGQEMRRITRTHLIKHGMTTNQYKEIFPGPIVCEQLAHALGKASRNMPQERRDAIGQWAKDIWTGKPKSDEHRSSLSKARNGVSWGRHTKEHRERMKEIARRNMLARIANGWKPRPLTADERVTLGRKISEARRRKHWSGPSTKGRTLALTNDQRMNRSAKRVAYLQTHTGRFKDTSLEIKMEQYLVQHDLAYHKQYRIDDRGSWLYDFYLPGLNLLLETDGEYFHSKSKKQINRDEIKQNIAIRNGFRFLRISDKDWRPELIFEDDVTQIMHSDRLLHRRLQMLS